MAITVIQDGDSLADVRDTLNELISLATGSTLVEVPFTGVRTSQPFGGDTNYFTPEDGVTYIFVWITADIGGGQYVGLEKVYTHLKVPNLGTFARWDIAGTGSQLVDYAKLPDGTMDVSNYDDVTPVIYKLVGAS